MSDLSEKFIASIYAFAFLLRIVSKLHTETVELKISQVVILFYELSLAYIVIASLELNSPSKKADGTLTSHTREVGFYTATLITMKQVNPKNDAVMRVNDYIFQKVF